MRLVFPNLPKFGGKSREFPLRIAILYSELADYTLACLRALKDAGGEILLVHWPVNPEAPFQFDLSFCEHFSRETLNDVQLLELVSHHNPDLILCSGWMDRGYVAVCRKFSGKIPTVLSMDNHWTGSWRQRVAQVAAPFTLRRVFNSAFVPGNVQKQFAIKLGFPERHIQTGFYCADTEKFSRYYCESNKHNAVPKRFLYLGRYVRHKGIFDLWEAFIRFRKNHPEWELWCVGTGDQYANRAEAEGIRHFGFVQPDQLLPILKETGVYILPSHFEPWGVSVQEMAAAGFAMLLSDRIGARETFVEEGANGAIFTSGSVADLETEMRWIASKSETDLRAMSQKSHELGTRHTPGLWAEKLLRF